MPFKEIPPSLELDPSHIRAFAKTFIPRWDWYALQLKDGTYIQKRESLTLSMVTKHLTLARRGYTPFTLGAYALDAQNIARWVCFDADAQPQWKQLLKLSHTLFERGITSYLEPSRRGGHLWLFTPPLAGKDIRLFAQRLLEREQIAVSEGGRPLIEIYPKQDVLSDGAGSFVRLPLGIHMKTMQAYHFIDLAGNPLAPTVREQVALLGQPDRVPQEFIGKFLKRSNTELVQVFPPPSPTLPEFKNYTPKRHEPLSEAIKNAISVYDFVSQYVPLNDQGRGLCPFHDDHKKSFGVNHERNYWHCYAGCGGGSVIDFWMKWRETHGQDGSFLAAMKELRVLLLK